MHLEYPEEGIILTVPKAGDKKKLLELSEKNVNYFIEELKRKKMLQLEGKSDKEKQKVLLNNCKKIFTFLMLPVHIECFDNSNFQGSYPVAAMVYFNNGIPDKSQYRKFNIKTVSGINDFASMKEVVSRRYKRLKNEKISLPQLIIIDGGKGQLNAAVEAIVRDGLIGKNNYHRACEKRRRNFFPRRSAIYKIAMG